MLHSYLGTFDVFIKTTGRNKHIYLQDITKKVSFF